MPAASARRSLVALAALAALAGGCVKAAPAPSAPARTGAASGSPSPSPSPSAAPSPAAGDASDLQPDDEQAAQAAMADPRAQAYMPSELLHDGGVMLYRLLAGAPGHRLLAGAPGHRLLAKGLRPAALAARPAAPAEWRRLDGKRGEGRLIPRRVPGEPDSVRVTARYAETGVLALRLEDAERRVLRKPYVQTFERVVKLKRPAKGEPFAVHAVGPITVVSQGARRADLAISLISLAVGGEAFTLYGGSDDALMPVSALPAVSGGQKATVVVALDSDFEEGATVFARFLGPEGDKQRVALRDDGVSPDEQADDGRYSGTLALPAGEAGLAHLAVDGLEARSFKAGTPVRYVGLGFSLELRGD